jgi:hypothetical protein
MDEDLTFGYAMVRRACRGDGCPGHGWRGGDVPQDDRIRKATKPTSILELPVKKRSPGVWEGCGFEGIRRPDPNGS